MDYENFSFTHINRNRLDEEWLGQAEAMHRAGIALAAAEQAEREAKVELEITKAETETAIRKDPAAFGLYKVTDASAKASVLTNAACQTAEETLNKASYEVAICRSAVRALEHRKKALENLVILFRSDYWSDPKEQWRPGMSDDEKGRVRSKGRARREQQEVETDEDDTSNNPFED